MDFIIIDTKKDEEIIKRGNEIFIVINANKNKIVRVGLAHRDALADEKLRQDEVLIFESDNILTDKSVEIIKEYFQGKTEIEIVEYTKEKLQLLAKQKPAPAPVIDPKEELRKQIKTIPKPTNQSELIELIENIRKYLELQSSEV